MTAHAGAHARVDGAPARRIHALAPSQAGPSTRACTRRAGPRPWHCSRTSMRLCARAQTRSRSCRRTCLRTRACCACPTSGTARGLRRGQGSCLSRSVSRTHACCRRARTGSVGGCVRALTRASGVACGDVRPRDHIRVCREHRRGGRERCVRRGRARRPGHTVHLLPAVLSPMLMPPPTPILGCAGAAPPYASADIDTIVPMPPKPAGARTRTLTCTHAQKPALQTAVQQGAPCVLWL
jgi:hypothetical protein